MKYALPLSLIALATLGACGESKPESFNDTIADPMATELSNAAPAELPPPLKASKSYRCKDNSLVYIDFFADDLGVNLRTDKAAKPVRLTAPEKGQPFEADGYKVEGSGSAVTVTLPGKTATACKA
jgi:hypothetical protein